MDIDEKMVFKKLSNLNISKSPGPDCMHPRILKKYAVCLTVPLTVLFRRSFNEMHVLWFGRMLIYQLFSRKVIRP